MAARLNHDDYTIAWIAVLPIEAEAALGMLDQQHQGHFPIVRGDDYIYIGGEINGHNVVVATWPAGQNYGVGAAAALVNQVKARFPNIWFALLVGVAAGLPNLTPSDHSRYRDIRLGDVLVCLPENASSGIVHYDLGKDTEAGFLTNGRQAETPAIVRAAIGNIQLTKKKPYKEGQEFAKLLNAFLGEDEDKKFRCLSQDTDQLFTTSADSTSQPSPILREPRDETERTRVWYGNIGSGNSMMRNARRRDELRDKYDLIGLEMEAAGIMNTLPTGVIRGVCDYGDGQKNKDWQPYAAAVAAVYTKGILLTINPRVVQKQQVSEAQTSILVESTYSRVYKRRVKDFIGRESQLQKMQTYFSSRGAKQPQILILQALGGQGKSQIALEYCRLSQSIYRGIFWVDGNSEVTVIQSFKSLAAELCEESISVSGDAETKIQFVKSVLEQWEERWLLVFDNYDDPVSFRNVERFFPSRGHGDILFTSRHKGLDRLGTVLEVPPMPTADGINLLLRGYPNINNKDHIEEGTKIVTRLGNLALAIDQAAAYIQHKKLPIEQLASFLTLYEARRKKILQHTSHHFWKYTTMQIHGKEEQDKAISAFTTWEMSFQQFTCGGRQTTEDARHFLTLSAFFDPSHIGESIFRYHWQEAATRPAWMRIFAATGESASDEGCSSSGDEVSAEDEDANHVTLVGRKYNAWDGENFWNVIAEAHNLSLLESISSENGGREVSFSLHPLIRDWLQLREKLEQRRGYTQEAIDFVVSAIRAYNTILTMYYQKGLLAAHVDACVLNNERFSDSQALGWGIASGDAASWFASFYAKQGRYGISEKLECLSLRTRETVLGKEHPDTLTSMNNLANVLIDQGKYEQAEEMHRQVVGLRETVLGKEHPDTLTSMNNLASVLNRQGKYEQAEEMHRQVVGLIETVLGKEHPDTLTSMNNLASVLNRQGKYEQAEEMHRQVVGLMETVLGKEHPDTLTSMNNLANVLSDQGKYEQAEEMHRQVVGLRETVLGKEHPDTLTSMNNLANVLSDQGKYEQAEEMHRQVVGLRETVLGKEHPDTLTSMNNLANVLSDQGKYEQAEEMHRQVVGLRETVLGKEHPDTLTSMNNLASVLKRQGKYEQAEEMHRQELALCQTVLGKEHPATLTSMNNLANVLSHQGKYEQAEEMHRQVVGLSETVLGKEHPATLTSMNNLANVLSHQGKYEQAEEMHRQVVGLSETVLGKEHPATLTSMNNLANVLSHQGKYEQAEEMHRQVVGLRETVLGKEHPDTLTSMNNLAGVLSDQGKYEQVEEIHRQELALCQTVLGKEHPDTLISMNNLASVLWSQDRLEEAGELAVRVLEARIRLQGSEHPATLTSMANLAYTRKSQGRDEEAIVLMQEATKLQREKLGFDHPDTIGSTQTLEEWLAEIEISERIASRALEDVLPLTTDCQSCDYLDQVD